MCAIEHTFLVTPLIIRESLASALVTGTRHHRQFVGQMTAVKNWVRKHRPKHKANTERLSIQYSTIRNFRIWFNTDSYSSYQNKESFTFSQPFKNMLPTYFQLAYKALENGMVFSSKLCLNTFCSSLIPPPSCNSSTQGSLPLFCQRCSFALPNFLTLNCFIHVLVLHSRIFRNENNNVRQLY